MAKLPLPEGVSREHTRVVALRTFRGEAEDEKYIEATIEESDGHQFGVVTRLESGGATADL